MVTKKNSNEKNSPSINVFKSNLVVPHILLTEDEKKEFLDSNNFELKDLPIILKNDPAIKSFDAAEDDIIKIQRNSQTAGNSTYYRRVVSNVYK